MRDQWLVISQQDEIVGWAYGRSEAAAKAYYRRYGDKRRKISKLFFALNPGNATSIRGKV